MKRIEKRESILLIEECFRNIQQEKEVSKNIRLIESAVKREFGITIELSIIQNKKRFFGMCVYPCPEEINKLTELLLSPHVNIATVEKIHRDFVMNGTHIVEVDSILLYDHNINASAGEITAILLHEIGHILTSNSMVCRYERAKEYMTMKSGSILKLVRGTEFVKKVFNIATLQIFSNHFNAQLAKERKADELAFKCGYGEELANVLGKLIANGHGERVKRSEKDMDKDVEITIDWLIVNVKELKFRKDRLHKSIKVLKMTTPSIYLKDQLDKIHSSVFKNDKKELVEKVAVINEAFLLSNIDCKKVKAPNGALDKSGRIVKLHPRDLDIYRAELERVDTVDDKIFLLERLYDLLDVAEYAKYMSVNEPRRVMQSEQTIDMYIKQVHDIINEVNKKKITKTKYGLFIKYPADYEG
jgi:hypothetical protein